MARSRLPVRLLLVPLEIISWVLTRILSRRGLCLCFLGVMAGLACAGWLRPPLSSDIRGIHIPLRGTPAQGPTPDELLYGSRAFVWSSPGVIMLVLVAVGGGVALLAPRRFWLAAGFIVCGALGCVASVAFNHPELIESFDRQQNQRRQIVSLLRGTVRPPIRLNDVPRVWDSPSTARLRGTLLRSLVYLRRDHALLLLPIAAFLLSARGSLGRRLGHLGLWCLAGLLFTGWICFPRLLAEWRWEKALQAQREGAWEAAERHALAAVRVFPELARLERTWMLLGKSDYCRGRDSTAAQYFRASQRARNGELALAVSLIEDLARRDQPSPVVHRWLASLLATRGSVLFQKGRHQAAESAWRRAIDVDGTQIYNRLFLAAIRARPDRYDPERIAGVVDPLIARLADDRSLRKTLQGMLGDSYFEAGQFAQARDRYEKSMAAYSLPKQINFRTQRGQLGM